MDPKNCPGEQSNAAQLPFALMKQLLMLNYHARDLPSTVVDEPSVEAQKTSKGLSKGMAAVQLVEIKAPVALHPQDVFHATFRACSPILRQVFMSKAWACKLASPIVIPVIDSNALELASFALQGPVLEWQDQDKATSANIKSLQFQIVSFLRIGRHLKAGHSKSDIINRLLFEDHHACFYTRHCRLGNAKRTISDGVIEHIWGLPGMGQSNFMGNLLSF